jgi:hypothetical protein
MMPHNSKNVEWNYYSHTLFNMLILLLLNQLVNVFLSMTKYYVTTNHT